MTKKLQTNITPPPRSEWLAFTPINAADAAGVIEAMQQRYARSGAKCFHFPGPWEASKDIYVAENALDGPSFDEADAISLTRRPDADGDYQVDLRWWGKKDQVQLTCIRIDSDGTETQIAQVADAAVETSTTLVAQSLSTTLSAADTREGGLSGGDQAPIRYEVRARTTDGEIARIEAMILTEAELSAADVP